MLTFLSRHLLGGLGAERADYGRERDAGPDAPPQGLRPAEAAEGRQDRGLSAHDCPDRRTDRDIARTRG